MVSVFRELCGHRKNLLLSFFHSAPEVGLESFSTVSLINSKKEFFILIYLIILLWMANFSILYWTASMCIWYSFKKYRRRTLNNTRHLFSLCNFFSRFLRDRGCKKNVSLHIIITLLCFNYVNVIQLYGN